MFDLLARRVFRRDFARLTAALLVCVVPVGFVVAQTPPPRDAVSDSVGATFGEFRVDESGNASYSIPIYAPPGTAGVAPKIALSYSSGAGNGWLGRGWNISGLSSITRCRRTREAGDFFDGSTPVDGNSRPVDHTNGDVFCLDGARLLLVSGTYGANGAEYRLELDPFTKVVSVGGNNGQPGSYTGPDSFTVKRKDGSTSTYGNTTDSRIKAVSCTQQPAPVCFPTVVNASWAINRFEDSTGNYIDYAYEVPTPSYVAPGAQFVPLSIKWTGKRQLPGQSTLGSSPYAGIYFHTIERVAPAGQDSSFGFQGGMAYAQTRELTGIEVRDQIDTGSPRTLRYYKPTFAKTTSGSGLQVMRSIKECRDTTEAVCYRPTTFNWSDQDGVSYAFATADTLSTVGETRDLVSSRVGDVDGDGRADIVWFRAAGPSHPTCANKNFSQVSFADRQETGGVSKLVVTTPAQAIYCSALTASNGELDTAWGLMDFDGDGRDDLIVADDNSIANARWHVYRSNGRPASGTVEVFDTSSDLLNVTIPTADDSQEQAQLGDFNGDGMIDMLYPTGPNGLAVRFLQRKSDLSGFEFSAAHTLQVPTSGCGGSCNINVFNLGAAAFGVAPDLNGDGRSDIVLRVSQNTLLSGPNALTQVPEQTWYTQDARERMATDQVLGSGPPQFFAFVMDARTTTTQAVVQYGGVLSSYNGVSSPTDARQFQFADFNGDSLPDLLYQQDLDSDDFVYALNRGNGFHMNGVQNARSGEIKDVPNREHLRLADVNGDGRIDVLFPSADSSPCAGSSGPQRVFRYRSFDYTNSQHGSFGVVGSSSVTAATCITGNTVVGDDPSQWDYFFADFDGDGASDFVKLRDDGTTPFIYTSRGSTSSRYKARDAITRITNGHGATTLIFYQPLTNKAVYRREKGSRLDPATDGSPRDPDGLIDAWGRGSPVLDLLSSQYVVSAISSSAPTRGDPGAQSAIGYRYAGAKVQTGGRGILGFASIVSFDAAVVDNGWTVTEQFYRQDFPFAGSPLQTNKWAMSGAVTRGSAAIDACSVNTEAEGVDCFYDPADAADTQHPAFGTGTLTGAMVRVSATLWGCKANGATETCDFPEDTAVTYCPDLGEASLIALSGAVMAPYSYLSMPDMAAVAGVGVQQPLFVYAPRTVDLDFDPGTAAITRHVCGLFAYEDSYGNATSSTIKTFSGTALSTELASKSTTNTFINDATNWRLGRMTTSSIVDTRAGVPRSRATKFDYEVDRTGYDSASDTGLMKSERIQPDGAAEQDLRTLYTLDDYGNQTYAFTCSRYRLDGQIMSDDDCRTTTLIQQRPVGSNGPATTVHRYVRNTYQQNGRYLAQSLVPFYSPTGSGNRNEQATTTIGVPDEFGNAVSTTDANGLVTTQLFGGLNRAYYIADSTGRSTTTIFRWCDQLTNGCPAGSSFRQKTVTAGAPTSFIYFDLLGRKVLEVTESFNAGVAGQHWSATCTAYDNHGRAVFGSVPFFLASSYGVAADPSFIGGSDPCSAVSTATTTTDDVLGRVRLVVAPDASSSTSTFSGLATTTTDSRGQKSMQFRNALGEVVALIQADKDTGEVVDGFGQPVPGAMVVTNEYDTAGNLRFVKRNAGNGLITSEVVYDTLGRKTQVIDPDRGSTSFEYNAAGEVIRTTNALDVRVDHDYDALGRLWRRRSGSSGAFSIAPDTIFRDSFENAGTAISHIVTDEFQFDTAADGLGSLDFERRTISTQSGTPFFRSHTYDSIGRPLTRQTSFDASTYTESTVYDAFGRVQTRTDASGDTTTTFYTAKGYTSHHTYSRPEVGTSGKFYEVLAQDAWGHITSERRNGTITTTKGYDPMRGWIDSVSTSSGSLQNWNFDFDTNGNLKRRNRNAGALVEDFTYDKLNRLTQVALSGSATTPLTTVMTYDKLGNLCSKGGIAYTYQGPDGCNGTGLVGRPHALSQAGTTGFVTDALGNMLLGDSSNNADDRSAGYDALEQIEYLTRGSFMSPSHESEFAYGPDKARYRQINRQSGSITRTTRYVGNVEVIIASGVTQTKRYLEGGAIVTTYSNQPSVVEDRYALTDQLGSVEVIVNDAGGAVESSSFDAWGLRRGTGNWQGAGTPLATTTRGFTGHEQLDGIGLIHMNGRIYDPTLGRFIQSDPLIDAGIQGLNRYSYVLNNPLSFTDPTGHLTWGEWMRVGIGIALTCATAGAAAAGTFNGVALTAGQQAFVVGAGGAIAGAANSQTLKGAAWGAVSALTFYGIGNYFEGATWAKNGKEVFGSSLDFGGYAAKVLAHGVAGGALQHLQGGRFGSGFAAAGVSQAFSGGVELIDPANPNVGFTLRVMASAMIGGVASDLTGGKFAHGAVTAAFGRAFNEEMSPLNRAHRKLWNAGVYFTPYNTELEAASAWAAALDGILDTQEFGSWIYRHESKYFVGLVGTSNLRGALRTADVPGLRVKGASITALVHNHPNGSGFSAARAWITAPDDEVAAGPGWMQEAGFNVQGDLMAGYDSSRNVYAARPDGTLLRWSHQAFVTGATTLFETQDRVHLGEAGITEHRYK